MLGVKMRIALLVPFAAVLLGAAAARAEDGLRITYDMSGNPLAITRDAAGTYQFDGLPYPGTVLYKPDTGMMYYQHPEEPEWHTVTRSMLAGILAEAKAQPGPAWQPWQGMATMRWNVTADKTACTPIFGSTQAATMAGLNAGDLLDILTELQWLNGGEIPNPCERPAVTTEAARKIGLPVLFTGPNGPWQLQAVVREDVPAIEVPRNADPITDETRLNLLLVQFSPNERVMLLKQFGNLPVARQVEAIGRHLSEEAQP